jgi:hypothetical protein
VPQFKRDELELLQEMSGAAELNLSLKFWPIKYSKFGMSNELSILLDQF